MHTLPAREEVVNKDEVDIRREKEKVKLLGFRSRIK